MFDLDALAELAGQSWPSPKISTPAKSSLELLAQGFCGAAAHGSAGFHHRQHPVGLGRFHIQMKMISLCA